MADEKEAELMGLWVARMSFRVKVLRVKFNLYALENNS